MKVLPGKILIVDDDPDIEGLISYFLKNKGYFIISAKDSTEAVNKAKLFKPDLFLLDIMVVNKDHLELIWQLNPMAIILLAGLEEERYKTIGINIRVHEYIPKPVKPEILVHKIETALRPVQAFDEPEQKQTFGDLEINITNFIVSYQGRKIVLAKKEFELLSLLVSKPGRVFLRNEILQRVWGSEVLISDRTIDVHIRKIRQKLGVDLIKTVKHVGYKFQM